MQMRKRHLDEAISALAARQHGVVALVQLKAIGVMQDAVHHRLGTGRLHRLSRGVYAVGHTALTEQSRLVAAVFACGPGAALSHRAAGRLWRITRPVSAIEVTCGLSRPPLPGIVIHRSPLAPEDCGFIEGVRVTTWARTLIDLADVLTLPQLQDAVHEAEVRRIFDLGELGAALTRAPGRRGRCKLDQALTLFTRNDLERDFLAICAAHRIEKPLVNLSIAGMEVDFQWPQARLAVEVDGGEAHRTRRAFEEDRRRDRKLTALGWRIMGFTWLDLGGDPAGVAGEVAQVIG